MIRKNCEECGRFYWSIKSKNRKYCSRSCSAKATNIKKRVTIKCDGCGQEMQRTPSFLNQNKGNYCSSKCFYKNGRKGKNVECNNCGKEVYKNLTQLNKHDSENYYCSLQCVWEQRQKRNIKNCENCGEDFECRDFESKKFCSRECYIENDNRLYPKTIHLREKVSQKRYKKKQRVRLTEYYMKSVFRNIDVPFKDIPEGLIELKRLNIKRKRIIRDHGT